MPSGFSGVVYEECTKDVTECGWEGLIVTEMEWGGGI